MEDPALAKGLVKRDIIRVVTPGTVIESSMLAEDKNNYLCAIYLKKHRRKMQAGVCFADISTGEPTPPSWKARDGRGHHHRALPLRAQRDPDQHPPCWI